MVAAMAEPSVSLPNLLDSSPERVLVLAERAAALAASKARAMDLSALALGMAFAAPEPTAWGKG